MQVYSSGLLPRVYKGLLQISIKRTDSPIENLSKDLNTTLPNYKL